jgi:hypothetical protein
MVILTSGYRQTDRQTIRVGTSILNMVCAENDVFQSCLYINILFYSFGLNVPVTWIILWTVKEFVRILRLFEEKSFWVICLFQSVPSNIENILKCLSSLRYRRIVPPLRFGFKVLKIIYENLMVWNDICSFSLVFAFICIHTISVTSSISFYEKFHIWAYKFLSF